MFIYCGLNDNLIFLGIKITNQLDKKTKEMGENKLRGTKNERCKKKIMKFSQCKIKSHIKK